MGRNTEERFKAFRKEKSDEIANKEAELASKFENIDATIAEKEEYSRELSEVIKDWEKKLRPTFENQNNVIKLSVGGKEWAMKRSTIALEGTMLSSWFSGE